VDWLVEANVSEKRSFHHFMKAEVITSALKMEAARFSETLASSNQSTRRFSPKEHNQKYLNRRLSD
jgi:hypothetical protein